MRDYPPDYLKTICTIDPLGSHRLLFTIDERMEIETIIWGILPLALCFALALWSLQLSRKRIRIWKIILSVLVLLALTFSGLILINMIRGAWPTFIPHMVIGAVFVILSVQQLFTSLAHRRSIQTS